MKPTKTAFASTVLARHAAAQREAERPPVLPNNDNGVRKFRVLQSRSEPAQRTLALRP